jgi:mannose-6-phosphate isomerase-like protein (cupin superfamily)
VLSIADLAERSLSGRDPVKLVPVACSGLDTTQMMVLRESLNAPANPNVDQMLYVVAGEAMLSLGGHEQPISSGWFALVPRGMAHTLTKRGRNPAIVLTTAGGQPCAAK